MKSVIISVCSTVLAALLFFGATAAKDAALAALDKRYILVADSLFNALQKKREEIWLEEQSDNPNQDKIEFWELQEKELEAELEKRGG